MSIFTFFPHHVFYCLSSKSFFFVFVRAATFQNINLPLPLSSLSIQLYLPIFPFFISCVTTVNLFSFPLLPLFLLFVPLNYDSLLRKTLSSIPSFSLFHPYHFLYIFMFLYPTFISLPFILLPFVISFNILCNFFPSFFRS